MDANSQCGFVACCARVSLDHHARGQWRADHGGVWRLGLAVAFQRCMVIRSDTGRLDQAGQHVVARGGHQHVSAHGDLRARHGLHVRSRRRLCCAGRIAQYCYCGYVRVASGLWQSELGIDAADDVVSDSRRRWSLVCLLRLLKHRNFPPVLLTCPPLYFPRFPLRYYNQALYVWGGALYPLLTMADTNVYKLNTVGAYTWTAIVPVKSPTARAGFSALFLASGVPFAGNQNAGILMFGGYSPQIGAGDTPATAGWLHNSLHWFVFGRVTHRLFETIPNTFHEFCCC